MTRGHSIEWPPSLKALHPSRIHQRHSSKLWIAPKYDPQAVRMLDCPGEKDFQTCELLCPSIARILR